MGHQFLGRLCGSRKRTTPRDHESSEPIPLLAGNAGAKGSYPLTVTTKWGRIPPLLLLLT
jgi:hypothetical protein